MPKKGKRKPNRDMNYEHCQEAEAISPWQAEDASQGFIFTWHDWQGGRPTGYIHSGQHKTKPKFLQTNINL